MSIQNIFNVNQDRFNAIFYFEEHVATPDSTFIYLDTSPIRLLASSFMDLPNFKITYSDCSYNQVYSYNDGTSTRYLFDKASSTIPGFRPLITCTLGLSSYYSTDLRYENLKDKHALCENYYPSDTRIFFNNTITFPSYNEGDKLVALIYLNYPEHDDLFYRVSTLMTNFIHDPLSEHKRMLTFKVSGIIIK